MGVAADDALVAAWRARALRATRHIGWAHRRAAVRRHPGGASFAIEAPPDQLFVATEVNEWALCAALHERDPERWSNVEALLVREFRAAREEHPFSLQESEPVLDETAAFARFLQISARESQPRLTALLDSADENEIPWTLDDADLTLGSGAAGRTFALSALPERDAVPWSELSAVPTAIVTGSNGKTTTVRLLAACARAQGWRTGYNCTDGVFLDGETLAEGDYSGPLGARMVVRDPRVQAAVLETARGGILRRGIAVNRADVAVVTNVSADHFGEYGIYDLDGLAEAKLTVASVLSRRGLLVLNADDAALRDWPRRLGGRPRWTPHVGWFSGDASAARLEVHRRSGAPTCGPHEGRLFLRVADGQHDLGAIADMPLSIHGAAAYNIANLAGAALAATALGIAPRAIAAVFARFGSAVRDNPGRMMRYEKDGVTVVIDYAHNPDGLRGFLQVAEQLRRGTGRLGLVLGHAGNRSDAAIEELARTAALFQPDLIVVKENEQQLRGRAPGEIPRVIRAELRRLGFAESAVPVEPGEVEAVRRAFEWARPGDVLALPIHSAGARTKVIDMLERG